MKNEGAVPNNVNCYKTGREHLYDEIAKLDALIRLQVLRFRDAHSEKQIHEMPGMQGLWINDREVDNAMNRKSKKVTLPPESTQVQ
ncbi:MAG: hypothetical protein GY950_03870, partial [bacterium]|nr:hypothetical protein [bacterium]